MSRRERPIFEGKNRAASEKNQTTLREPDVFMAVIKLFVVVLLAVFLDKIVRSDF